MPITPGSVLLLFHKIDQVDSKTRMIATEEFPQAVFISASEKHGLENLRMKMGQLVDYAIGAEGTISTE